MSQKVLAAAVGVTPGSVTGWRKGAIPSGATLQKIADYFQVSTDELLTGRASNLGVKLAVKAANEFNGTPEEKQLAFERTANSLAPASFNMWVDRALAAEEEVKALKKQLQQVKSKLTTLASNL